MPDTVADSSTFVCPFCTSKLKLVVPSSFTLGGEKNVGNTSSTLFPPPGGQCTVCPSSPVPCVPSVNNVTAAQDAFISSGLPLLGVGCLYMCSKGGLIILDSSAQSSAKHDEAEKKPSDSEEPDDAAWETGYRPLDSGRVEETDDFFWIPTPGGAVVKGGKLLGKAGRGLFRKIFGGGKKPPPKPPKPSPKMSYKKAVAHRDAQIIRDYLKNIKTVKRDKLIKDLELLGLKRQKGKGAPKGDRTTFVDKQGKTRVQIHPPDSQTNYHHIHIYNTKVKKAMEEIKKKRAKKGTTGPLKKHEKKLGQSLDSSLKPVPSDSKAAHIEIAPP